MINVEEKIVYGHELFPETRVLYEIMLKNMVLPERLKTII